jgi:hypothetical protein
MRGLRSLKMTYLIAVGGTMDDAPKSAYVA